MLQHLDIDIGLEDELEQDDDQDQQQKDEADDDSSGTQTDGEESAEAPTSMDGEDSEGDPSESAEPQAADADSDMMEGEDRKSVVKGKSVSVRVDLGGRRIIKKKQTHTNNKQRRAVNAVSIMKRWDNET